jgi:hypothetical protein
MKALKKTYQTLLDNYSTSGVNDGHPTLLWNCLNRYVRQGLDESSSTGVTLFFAHATGFPKEVRSLETLNCFQREYYYYQLVSFGNPPLETCCLRKTSPAW